MSQPERLIQRQELARMVPRVNYTTCVFLCSQLSYSIRTSISNDPTTPVAECKVNPTYATGDSTSMTGGASLDLRCTTTESSTVLGATAIMTAAGWQRQRIQLWWVT